ncbi:tetratricopeptide repeat protein [Bernardetia sp. MNP-M8]|uniref:tetratricopeptide repeat protein n=1 Tax=Bernardetia sp. MNP-M8 TaxID=3127470 RepID=UPI0030CF4494
MTKSILKSIIVGTAFVTGSFLTNETIAQNGALTSAEFFATPQEGNYEKALEKVRQATYHKKTEGKARTWYTRAKVFTAIVEAGVEDKEVAALVENPIDSAFASMTKALEVEKAEGDDKYTKRIEDPAFQSDLGMETGLQARLKNAILNNVQKYQDAEDFVKAYETMLPLATYLSTDTTNLIYTAYFANKAEKLDKSAFFYEKLGNIEEYTGAVDAYQSAAYSYYKLEDSTNFLRVLEKGAERFPQEPYFITNAADVYIQQENYDKAIEMLQKAEAIAPDDVRQLTILARLYDQLEQKDKAFEYYEKIYKLDPQDEEAIRALGVGYYQIAGDLYRELEDEAKKSKDKKINKEDARYKKMITYADKSIPYLMAYKDLTDEKSAVYSTLMNLYMYKGDEVNEDKMRKLAEKK